MKYISLFSGIEAATVAWKPLGWKAVAYSEIDPFPKAVLAHHYPDVPDLGDMTKVDWSGYRGAVDIVVGGSPCQAFSVAGLRKALDDPRGHLMLEYLRACHEIDPEWIVWENVPGVLSADHGRAFMSVYKDMSPTLTAHDAKAACFVNQDGVRRLMPVECERLQGFPDGYTDVPWRGKAHAPDSKRYKALGNSMAVPVMRWIGEGIDLVNGSM